MKLTFEGETLTELVQQMQVFLVETGNWWQATSGADAPAAEPEETSERAAPAPTDEEPVKRKPGRPKKTVAEEPAPVPDEPAPAPEEEPAPAPEEEKAPDFDAIRSSAITKLMNVYNMGGAHSVKVKGVLKEFGVAKFAEVPEERLKELLTRAVELESEAA